MLDLPLLDYCPAKPYRLDAEIFSVTELRRRISDAALHSTYRYACYALWCVTRGECTQVIDFEPLMCRRGTLLVMRPGQVHTVSLSAKWDGWIVLFRPEFLQFDEQTSNVECLLAPHQMHDRPHLEAEELRIVTDAIVRMQKDANHASPAARVQLLLRHQLHALLLRLAIASERQDAVGGAVTKVAQRFRRFRDLVERKHDTWHQVRQYADGLHCSEKTLTRATLNAVGLSAKAYIAARIVLEAKRLLAHTSRSVTSIGEGLGFDDTTNFVKFFKRESGCTPAEFRRQRHCN